MGLIDGRGRWYRWNTKPTTGDRRRLDAGALAKQIDLSRSASGSLQWGNGSNIAFDVVPAETAIRLRYNFRGEPVEPYLVRLASDPQPFGGHRYYFHCPACQRRVKHLYLGQYFFCRRCAGLTYASKQITKGDQKPQLKKRLWAIQRRLGVDVTLFSSLPSGKPRGMHWRTYARLRAEYAHLSQLYSILWAADLVHFADLEDMPELDLAEYRRWEDARFYDGDGWAWATLRELHRHREGRRRRRPQPLTLGELATAAGVSVAFAREAQAQGLLRPDRGRDTRVKRYRPRLANWLAKLHGLREEGYDWDDLRTWTRRRWRAGHEGERLRPRPKS